jgi:hypothetical protein
MVTERFDVPHIGSQHFERLVSAVVGDTERLGVRFGSRRDVYPARPASALDGGFVPRKHGLPRAVS